MALLARVVCRGEGFSGAPALQVWDFARVDQTTPTNAEADAMLAAVRAFYDTIKANFTTGQTWAVQPSPTIRDAATGDLTGIRGTTTPAVVTGTTAASLGPQQVAILVKKRTSNVVAGRLLKGRTYLGPFQTAVTAQNAPQSATLTGINAALATLLAAGGVAWTPVIWSRPVPPSTALPAGRAGSIAAVTSWGCGPTFGTQRGRNFV